MSKRKKDWGDKPIGKFRIIENFLPPPEELLPPEEMVKITISLDKTSLAFFKKMAEKIGAKYQKMIREVLKGYARRYLTRLR